jgi:hypothetical protein
MGYTLLLSSCICTVINPCRTYCPDQVLQALFTPITQIPICVLPTGLLLILSLGVCALTVIVDTDNESRLIPMTKIKNINMAFNGKIVAISAIAHFGFACLFLYGASFPIFALINAFQHMST